ncbi:hypothetical protein BGX38DRAFT_732677 [Terfezia claveryi]|nr:hypothetical protein BGX38DRAFT_732677 [Terfezia claveryi]
MVVMPTKRVSGCSVFVLSYINRSSPTRFSARLGSTKSLTSRSICFPSSKPSLQAPPKAPKPHARTATKPLPGASASGTGRGTAVIHAERTERPVQNVVVGGPSKV